MKYSKILVTGGAGFIGSEFVRQAVKSAYKVVVVDKLTYAGDCDRLNSILKKFTFYKTDICDQPKIAAILKRERPSVVVHFAAESHVDRSILDDAEFVRSNLGGTQSLLSACRRFGIERFLHMSTDEVYGEIAHGKFLETSPISPNSPYSASKAAADLLVKAYVRTYQFPCIIIRPSNNYGPWQYPEKFIPVIIYKALQNQLIPVYAKGLNVREWLHISDCASAILHLLKKGTIGETYNLGSGFERTNIEVVKTILHFLKKPESLISFVADRPGHDIRYAVNFNKIRRELAWNPKITFVKGMRETVLWYQDHFPWLKSKVYFLEKYWKQVYK